MDSQNHLLGFVFYRMFDQRHGLHAMALAKVMGIVEDDLEKLLRKGCYVNFSYINGKAKLEDLLMTQHKFEQLRSANPSLHLQIKEARQKAQARWSNDKKTKIETVFISAVVLPNPVRKDIELAFHSACNLCASQLRSVGKMEEADAVLELIASTQMVTSVPLP